MTDKQALLALADRCEAAPPEQQRALLEEARRLLFPEPEMGDLRLSSSPYWAWASADDLFGTQLDHHAYESAALSMLPEGWAIERLAAWPGHQATCLMFGTHDENGVRWHKAGDGRVHASAATLALVLLAALLKTKAQEVE